MKELTDKEKRVRKELSDIYPQLEINCRNTAGAAFDKHGGDLLAVCVEFFLEKDVDYQLKVIEDGKLEHYITKMMRMQLHLGTTRFYHHYRKFNEKQRDLLDNYNYKIQEYDTSQGFYQPFEDEENEALTCLQKIIQDSNPYEKMLIDKLIIGDDTMTAVSKQYNIGFSIIKKDLIRIKAKMKRLCQQYL